MFIEEIIIDGFKSYATRTVIAGFDANFNAITGLNGSGKSNILDAICFVLGISNLTQVRVNNLQELVYKQGQAGVTKASVTIVFNNEDRKASPVGYEQYDKITVTRQVVIGGRNKYLINGHNAQLNRVQNLFHSVQLNVNNPHFLIMQGRITKVLNMKPPEILAMIEEAAGTRMFEIKKIAALKTIEKKQKKVDEIERILTEEITPTLDNLRKERTQYIQWSNNQTQIERLSRFCTAFEFAKAQDTLQRSSEELDEMQDKLKELEKQKELWNNNVGDNRTKINKLTEQKDKEMDGDFKKLDAKAEELSKELVKLNSSCEHKKEALSQERALLVKNQKTADAIKAEINKGKDKVKADKETLGQIESENKDLSTKYKELQKQLQDALAGIASEGVSDSATVADQIMEAKREATNAESEIKKAGVKIKHLESELTSKRKAIQTTDNEFKKLVALRDQAAKELESVKGQLAELHFDEKDEASLKAQRREELNKVEALRERISVLTAALNNVQVSFSDPTPGFDRSKVKGVVARLIALKDPQWATALEVAAGNRLYNLVVDTEATSKALLDHNSLARKTTMIPLNKITNQTLDPQKLKAAEKLVGPENVQLALLLVEYEQQVQNAMKYVFGNTLLCPTSDDARKVTFDKQVNTRSVTLQGDLFDPAGSLTGGSRSPERAFLARIQELKEADDELKHHSTKLASIEAKLKVSEKFNILKHEYQLKAHELELVEARLQQNPYYHLSESLQEMEDQLKQQQAGIAQLQNKFTAAEARHKELTQHEQDFKGKRDDRFKKLEKQIAETKKKLAASTEKLKACQQDSAALVLESGELEAELQGLEQEALAAQSTITKLSNEIAVLEQQISRTKAEYESAREQADKKREKMQSQSKAIQELISDNDKLSKKIADADVEVKKIEHKISRFNKEQKDAAKFVQHMEKQHQWIATEKQFFGKPKTDYDFQAQDPVKAEKRLTALQEEQDLLSKSINKKVMSMFEKAEQEFQDLKQKKSIIENDKAKIEAVIAELDEKKTDALNTTWQKVNKDFGSIFSTLLPGTKAKLEPPQGQTVMEGLQVKVAFGDVWKETLVDLSGGQRSLLALSLILSLLLFKPAPMYILDEIDAALDLSHTQNIGQMLKTHFTHSQFIIVSLKEGMFNNANVLFETKFIDGVSTVTRTTPKAHQAAATRAAGKAK